jgi:hypothetical protein
MNIIAKANLENFFHFRQTPDDKSITVFNNGNSKGLIDSIPIGGHIPPNSTVGERAL